MGRSALLSRDNSLALTGEEITLLTAAAIIAIGVIAIPIILSITAINKSHTSDNATVARICHDGSYIYHYSDDSYRTSLGYLIDDVNTICDNK